MRLDSRVDLVFVWIDLLSSRFALSQQRSNTKHTQQRKAIRSGFGN